MSSLISAVAELLKLPPAVVGIALLLVALMIFATVIICGFHYLQRRNDNRQIGKYIEKADNPDAAVIAAIRGRGIAATRVTESTASPDLDGVLQGLLGAVRQIKP